MKTKQKRQSVYSDLTLKSLKQHVIIRGMDFERVLSSSVPDLQNWLFANHNIKEDPKKLIEYDEYIEDILRSIGSGDMIHPSLRLSYVGDKSENFEDLGEKPKKIRDKGVKVVKEKTSEGIYSGTKKALTYECQKGGKTIEDTIKIVLKQFSDASEKSIKIWYRKATKGTK